MIIAYDNVHAHVRRYSDEELKFLVQYLSMPNQRAGIVPGASASLSFYDAVRHRFPAGILPKVRKAAKTEGFKLKLRDWRPPAPEVDLSRLEEHTWARDYQLEAATAALTKERGIIKLPTGSGKGLLPTLIASCVPGVWLFVAHRTELVLDAANRWEQHTGLPAPRIVRGPKLSLGGWMAHGLVCATFSMLLSLYKQGSPGIHWLQKHVVGLIVDECHTAAASWNEFLVSGFVSARFRIGLSATPLDRLDRRNIMTVCALGPVIYKKTIQELVERKVVSQCHVYVHTCEQISYGRTLAAVRRELILRSRARNELVCGLAREADGPTLLFVKLVPHGQLLEKLLLQDRVQARFVWGTHSTEYRQAAARDLVAGRLDVVITNKIWHEGINIPALRSIINAAGGKSVIETLQRVGRGSRIVESKKYDFDLYEIYDKGQKWLEEHSKKRLAAYKREGYEIHVT